jgi:hypothetical protein
MTKLNFVFNVKNIPRPFSSYYDSLKKEIIISFPQYWKSFDVNNENNYETKEYERYRNKSIN